FLSILALLSSDGRLSCTLFHCPVFGEYYIAKSFTCVLRNIVATIDKYGLKKRHLNKHNKQVTRFFEDVLSKDYISETAMQYQRRLARNRDKLFLFLNHDNVSWNNNAVEHAIKLLATHKTGIWLSLESRVWKNISK
ncbi:MAG: hypothetical protein JW943_14730, partial [Deltaproteobacteria bacterium]|nr:hypothetical protein [Deltaproteobacteria bacterium]